MPGRTTKYTAKTNSELEFRVLDILNTTKQAMTIDQIKQHDMVLAPHTSQKLARVLAKLIEMGFVRKGKSKRLNRMLYKAVSAMEEEGYEVDDN
ncbi:MAG: hypothetical protein NC218_11805 [Acetobacter sp.]|nr:hypothetical protein [Acetobacter sp.]